LFGGGTCEQWIKEGKGAIKWTRLSCRTIGNFLRTLATPEPIKDRSLTSLKEKLIKIGAKVVSHGRYVAFQMAEVAIPRQNVPGDFAIDRGTTTAAATSARVRRRSSRIQKHPTGGGRPNASENHQISPLTIARAARAGW
jgi:hypothetical protein